MCHYLASNPAELMDVFENEADAFENRKENQEKLGELLDEACPKVEWGKYKHIRPDVDDWYPILWGGV